MNNKLLIIILLLLVSPAMANIDTISIYGTNASNAKTNLTQTGNQSVNIVSWSVGGIKTFYINITNTSDTLTLNVYNNTANQIDEILINGISINGLQADNSGLITFNRVQTKSNVTWTVRPALQAGGYNWSWGWFQNLWVVNQTIINNVTITNITTLNATNVQGNGSGLYGINGSNVTGLNTVILGGGGIIVTTNAANNYTISGDPFLSKWDLISYNTTYNTKYATTIVKDNTFLTTGQYLSTNNVAGNGFIFTYYSGDIKNKTLNMLGQNVASRIAIYHNNVNVTMFANLSAEDPDTAWNVTLTPKKGINTINITAEDNHGALYNYVYKMQSLWVTDP